MRGPEALLPSPHNRDSSSPTSGLSISSPFKAVFFKGGSGNDTYFNSEKTSFYIAFSKCKSASTCHISF